MTPTESAGLESAAWDVLFDATCSRLVTSECRILPGDATYLACVVLPSPLAGGGGAPASSACVAQLMKRTVTQVRLPFDILQFVPCANLLSNLQRQGCLTLRRPAFHTFLWHRPLAAVRRLRRLDARRLRGPEARSPRGVCVRRLPARGGGGGRHTGLRRHAGGLPHAHCAPVVSWGNCQEVL